MDDDFIDWTMGYEDAATLERAAAAARELDMFDPPLPGSLLVGQPLLMVPDSDIKYKSFLHWWFAVGRKAPGLAMDGWCLLMAPYASEGRTDAIPKEDWERLPQSERDAIERWVDDLPVTRFYY